MKDIASASLHYSLLNVLL